MAPDQPDRPDVYTIMALGGTPTSLELADEIRTTYRKYVVFHSDYEAAEAGFMALWTMHTYVFMAASHTPYPLITAPTSEAGKTRVFETARTLVHRPHPVVDPTAASLFRIIDEQHPTVLIDEADLLGERGIRQVLNAGFQPGTPIARARATYDVFCPKAFSGIEAEKPPLTKATASRCVRIPIRRALPDDPVSEFNMKEAMANADPLREAMKEWGKENFDALEDARPAFPSGLSDRQRDSWESLFAIADLVGAPWSEDSRGWAITLAGTYSDSPDPNIQLLSDVKRVLDAWPGKRISTKRLADERNTLEDRDYAEQISPRSLGIRLGAMGIHPESSSWREAPGGPSVRGFTVRSGGEYTASWADAFRRYRLEVFAAGEDKSKSDVADVADVAAESGSGENL